MKKIYATKNNIHDNNLPLPWEVLVLVAHYLDPKSLSISSCVSTTWSTCFSSDHLWAPLFSATFPSLSTTLTSTTLPRCRLYAIARAAYCRRLKTQQQPKPHLSLDRLLFTVSLSSHKVDVIVSVITPCDRVRRDPHGLFRFDIEVEGEGTVDEVEDMKVTWNVVERGWTAMFTMAEDVGRKGAFVSSVDGWFSEELPSPGCCSSTISSGLVADLRVGLVVEDGDRDRYRDRMAWGCRRNNSSSNSKVRIEKVSVGILSILTWRYVSLEDGLSYLQHFLPVS